MNPVLLSQIAQAAGGSLMGEDRQVVGFSTDTRTIAAGDVYFCLRGDNFDGHDYVQKAVEQGAVAVIGERQLEVNVSQVIVADTRSAFGRFASLWRSSFDKPVIGVTGSNGKTTVKQLLASIFSHAGSVHYTRANDNNEIGVPQTLLGLRATHDYAVVEMGASGNGEIQWLGELVQPTVSVITNASAAHLEGFGDAQSVAEEKGWIFRSLAASGTAVINADDQFFNYWQSICGHQKIITFGVNGDVTAVREADGSVVVRYAGQSVRTSFPLAGRHNVMNAAAAAACAIATGVSLETVAKGLEAVEPVPGRLNMITLVDGMTVIDDTYNANPASTRAAIDVLSEFNGRKILALGDLLELGANEVDEHKSIGRYAQSNKVDQLLACGELTRHAVDSFGPGATWFDTQEQLVQALADEFKAGSAVVVKGSRSMKMERVVVAMTERFAVSQTGVCC